MNNAYKKHPQWLLCALLAATPALAGELQLPLDADKADRKKWECKFCEQPSGWFGYAELALGYQSEDALRYQNVQAANDQELLLLGNAQLSHWGAANDYLTLYIKNLAQQTPLLGLRQGKIDDYRLELSYRQLQSKDNLAVSPFAHNGSETLQLPASWTRSGSSAAMDLSNAARYQLGSERERLELNIIKQFDQGHWRSQLNYRVEERQGKQLYNANMLVYSAQLPRLIDEKQAIVDASLAYQAANWQLQLAYYGAVFENAIDSINWDNPFSTGAASGQAAAAPDNRAQQLTLSGYYQFAQSQLQGSLSSGEQTQDQAFLPYSSNNALVGSALPAGDLDAQVDTLNAQLRLLSRISKNWRITANYRYDERDNQTRVLDFAPVHSDSLAASGSVQNRPYSYDSEKFQLESSWRADRNTRIRLGYQLREDERDYQERKQTEENGFWTELDLRQFRQGNLKLYLSRSTRSGSDYEALDNGQNSLMRKFSLADRNRVESRLSYSFTPVGPWSGTFSLQRANDDYDSSAIGLQEASDRSVDLSLSYQLSDKIHLQGYSQWRWLESEQLGNISSSQADWRADNDDEIHSSGIAVDMEKLLDDKLDIRIGYHYSFSRGQTVSSHLRAASTDSYPDIRVLQHRIESQARYRLNKQLDITARANYQRYQDSDWHIDSLQAAAASNLLDAGLNSYNYNGLLISAGAQYRF